MLNGYISYNIGMNKYYIYAFCKPDGTPYYIGKGHGNRMNSMRRSELCKRHVAKYGKNLRYIEKDMTEESAFELEKFLISELGRIDKKTGVLTNHTDGGEGASNPSKETTAKRSKSLKETYQIEEVKNNLSKARKIQWAEKRDAMIAGLNKPETKVKNSNAAKDRWATPGYREKMMASRALSNEKRIENIRKVKADPEHREKISKGVKEAWKNPEKRLKFIDGMNQPDALERRAEATRKRYKNG